MYLMGVNLEYVHECSYRDRKRMHNLKYFTWVEQRGKTVEELNAQWYQDDYWTQRWHRAESVPGAFPAPRPPLPPPLDLCGHDDSRLLYMLDLNFPLTNTVESLSRSLAVRAHTPLPFLH